MLEKFNIPEQLTNHLDNIISALLILVIGMVVMKIVLHIVRKTLEKSTIDEVLYHFILKIAKIALWVVLLLLIMECFGFKASSLLTVLAAAGAAIALALKDSLANVAGGIMILINKPFSQDDYVDIGGATGKVKKIDLFVTHLHTYDNKVVTIPNGIVNTSILTNYTQEEVRRVDCKFSVSYDSDIKVVKDILSGIAESNPMIMKEPEPVIGVANHGDSGIIMDLFAWRNTDDYYDVKYYLEEEVKLAFDREGIVIPFPQMDVRICGNDTKNTGK
jgi:small conductance mechanosensitive channel